MPAGVSISRSARAQSFREEGGPVGIGGGDERWLGGGWETGNRGMVSSTGFTTIGIPGV